MARRLAWWLVVSLVVPLASIRAQSVDTVALRNAIAQAGGRVIIGVKPARGAALRQGASGMPAAQLDAIEQRISRQYPLTVHGRAPLASAIFATLGDSDLVRVLADSNVELIVPDQLGVPVDAISSLAVKRRVDAVARRAETTPWGVTTVGAPAAWTAGLTGAGIKVGVMDGGIDYTHPDLNVVGGYNFPTATGTPAAYADNIASCAGHGTHVAGTIGARNNGSGLLGVAPGVSLYALKVFQDFGGSCLAWESDQIAALNWAAANGIRVVNISIGNASYNQIYQNAITSAIAAGVTVVASAGNGSGGAIVFPGAYVGVIAVGAIDQSNNPASYQSVGPQMWVTAPGTNILSTMPGGSTGTKSGTSMAAPHVVGVAALMLQAQPTWTPAQVQLAMKVGATNLGVAGFDNATGWGLVKAPTSTSGNTPVTLTVSPSSRSASATQGAAAPGDNASVTLSGTNAATTAWTASKKKSWTTLTTASGTGSGTVAWTRSTAGLAVGTYVDTITVTAVGITPAVLYDTLKITAIVIPVTMAVSPAARSVSVTQGAAAPGDNATVTLSGTNAATTAWTASKKKSWTTLTIPGNTGSGTVAWTRSTTGLAAGTYVDTITVSAVGVTSAVVYDTVKVTAIPVTMAVSPAARSVSVTQGAAAPGDNATVTLSGTNAATTAWTASKKQSWTTLTTASDTGSGTVAWTRGTTGLAVGTYVDTITISAVGVTPVVVYDTVRVTAVPVVIALAPTSRSTSVPQGGSAPGDIASVILGGTNAASTTWTAAKKASWNTLTASSGTGSGGISWTRNAAGLAPGKYIDTITVSAAGVTPATLLDTLTITAIPIVVTVSPSTRAVAVLQGGPAPGDNAAVTLTGTNAATTSWSATRLKSWTTLTTASGTGNGTVAWNRNATGLVAGTYVDTLTITAGGLAQAVIFDTLKVSAPVPVTVAIAPVASFVTLTQGSSAPAGSAAVTLSGTNAASVSWTATKKKTWLTLTTSSGTGSGTLAWTRGTAVLAVGTHVDTITVTAAGVAPAIFIDTVRVTAVSAIVATVTPAGRAIAVLQGSPAAGDNAQVGLSGTNAASTSWSVAKKKSWTTLTSASGVGNGAFAWSRNATGLVVGTYVDTLTVTAAGGSVATLFDTLKVLPIPVTVSVAPSSRSATATAGGAAPLDSATVTLSGTNAATTAWTASKKKSWTVLTTSSDTGSGTVAWTRSTTGLAVGTYVDTITVSAVGVTPAFVYDTLTITAVVVPVTMAVSPAARSASAAQGAAALGDNAAVTLSGTNAATTVWTASKKKSWTTLTTATDTGSGTVAWTRSTTGLAVGTYVDTITISAVGVTPAVVYDTLKITAAAPGLVVALTPGSRSVTAAFWAAVPGDNATVTLSGTNAATTAWTATRKKSWTALTTASGTGSGMVAWARNGAGMAIGTYVDTITVAVTGLAPVVLYDTMKIVPAPVTLTVSPGARSVSAPQGSAVAGDNASVTLGGTNGWSTVWSASKKKSWTTLTTAIDTGSGTVAWTRNTTGLAAGTYVDTITVSAAGVTPAVVYDTLKITPTAVTVALAPAARSTSIVQGGSGTGSSATITLSGPGAAGTGWSATARKSWTTVTTPSGVGSGTMAWTRATASLAVGLYVDTLTVAVAGAVPAQLIDSVRITAAPVAAVFAPLSRRTSITMGSAAPGTDAHVYLSGTGATVASWSVTKRGSWTTMRTSSGTGNGVINWNRNAIGLGVGTYVDTLVLTGAGIAPAMLLDTLTILPAAAPLTGLKTSVSGVHEVVVLAAGLQSATTRDSTTVLADAPQVTDTSLWYASASSGRVSLVTTEGMLSSSKVAWVRAVEGLSAGRYIDTIVVALVETPEVRTHIVDTLDVISVVLPAPEAAAQELFGTGHLNVDQRSALDQIGNHNGQYDLGDFLAWVDRAGIHLSATIRKQLLTLPATPAVKPKEPPGTRDERR